MLPMATNELSSLLLNPARNPGESYEDYKARRTLVNKSLKNYLRSGEKIHTKEETKEKT